MVMLKGEALLCLVLVEDENFALCFILQLQIAGWGFDSFTM
jgi:hypothetical protein